MPHTHNNQHDLDRPLDLPVNMTLAFLLVTCWDKLLDRSQKLFFHEGQSLYYEGHLPCGIYIQCSGRVRLSSQNQFQDRYIDASPLTPFVLGAESLSPEKPFDATCQAMTDCIVYFIPKSLLTEFVFLAETKRADMM